MARKKTRLYPMQLPVNMVQYDAHMMGEEEWQATYAPVFGTRERARQMAAISYGNGRPFIVVPLSQEVYERVMAMMQAAASDGES